MFSYSSVGSFYFPALMMVFVYARIFIAARSRARKHIEKKRLKVPIQTNTDLTLKETNTFCTSFNNLSPPDLNKEHENQVVLCPVKVSVCPVENKNGPPSEESSSTLPLPKSLPPQIVIEASTDSRRQSWNIISTSELISSINIADDQLLATRHFVQSSLKDGKDGNNQSACSPAENSETEQMNTNGDQIDNDSKKEVAKVYFPGWKSAKKAFRFRKPRLNELDKSDSLSKSVNIDDDSDNNDLPTYKEHLNCESKVFLSAPKLIHSKFGSSLSIADYEDSDLIEDDKKRNKGRVQYHDPPIVGLQIPSDAERHKRKIAKARERRATLIVGLIMAAFITAWLPFFVLYVLAASCITCKETIPEGVFAVAFWLGYCNSGKTISEHLMASN